jgi:hypothetical protein
VLLLVSCSSELEGSGSTILPAYGADSTNTQGPSGAAAAGSPSVSNSPNNDRVAENTNPPGGLVGPGGSSSEAVSQSSPNGPGGSINAPVPSGAGGNPPSPGGIAGNATIPVQGNGGAGTTPAETQSPTTPPPNVAGAVVVDDFEGVALGAAPNPALWRLGENGSAITVSNEQVRSGRQALKVVGGNNRTMMTNTTIFPLPAGELYFRVWMRLSNANFANHISFIDSNPGNNDSQSVRFGGQAGFYHANLAAQGDGLSPNPFSPCDRCLAPVANTWQCLRGSFNFRESEAQLFVDNTLAVDAVADSVRDNWHSGSGILPTNADTIGFGWGNYSGTTNVVYYDDLAMGYQPIACN